MEAMIDEDIETRFAYECLGNNKLDKRRHISNVLIHGVRSDSKVCESIEDRSCPSTMLIAHKVCKVAGFKSTRLDWTDNLQDI